MIKKETCAKIWSVYREIETAENLIKELERLKEESKFNETEPRLKDAFGRRKDFQFGIPSGDNGHRLYEVRPELAELVIKAHIEHKKAELLELNEQAKMELSTE